MTPDLGDFDRFGDGPAREAKGHQVRLVGVLKHEIKVRLGNPLVPQNNVAQLTHLSWACRFSGKRFV